MFKNYLKIALRNLYKHKIDSAISIGGLAVGIAGCILLILFVNFEWSFDNFHTKSDRIYRVVTKITDEGGDIDFTSSTPYQLGPELKANYPELENFVRVQEAEVKLQIGTEYRAQQVLFADSAFLKLFSFDLLRGSPQTVLKDPGNIVLTESKAKELFGKTDVIGEIITVRLYEEDQSFQISGVAADPPANSSLSFEIVLPYQNYPNTLNPFFQRFLPQRWDMVAGETFVLLDKSMNPSKIEAKLHPIIETHFSEKPSRELNLQPLEGIYLNPEINSRITASSSPIYTWILAGIALVILLIACINFMSLTLSRSTARASEIGIRKVSGAKNKQLILQFLGEAFLICCIAFVAGIIIAELALPYLSAVIEKPISFAFTNYKLWLYLGCLVCISALITGLYPSLTMARKDTTLVLKNSRLAERIPSFVKVLTITQFTLAILFVSSAFIMHQQINFILERNLGIDKENVILIRTGDTTKGKDIYNAYEDKARGLANVQAVSATYGTYGNPLMSFKLKPEENRSVETGVNVTNTHFLETLQIELLEGRTFSEDRLADLEKGAIVNQAFVESMGWETALGKVMPSANLPETAGNTGAMYETLLAGKTVIGVVENFHYESLYNKLKPMVMVSSLSLGNGVGTIWTKIGEGQIKETLAELEEVWKSIAPAEPFQYSFLDDIIQRQYEEEQRWKAIVNLSSFFAIALSCFGLFGLASLSAQRRTKEIGIRKVLGATVVNIVTLLSRDFVKLVILGFVIAVPIAWFVMNQWLADFAYRIEIGTGIFALAGLSALVIALLTVSWQSIKAALMNPVDSLKNE